MKYSEKWGDSIESAVELALSELKLAKDQVKVTILEEPSKGFFGIGSRLAKVRVEEIIEDAKEGIVEGLTKAEEAVAETIKVIKKPETMARAEKQTQSQKSAKQQKPKREFKIEGTPEQVSSKPENLIDQEEHPAKEFLEKMIEEMGLSLSVKVAANEDSVYIDLDGKDTGTIIGKRGQTLDAVQYLASLVVNKGEDEYIRVIVDAEGYRSKREDALKKLAYRIAEKVVKTGRSVRLEPMNPYERKVIHTTLQTVPAVATKSEGAEPHRRVVIEPAKK